MNRYSPQSPTLELTMHPIGRFAPSPTGPLHFGSLVAAMGSYLQARQGGGQWLLRIEDIDPPREIPGAADAIIRSLDRLGFEWDGGISWQHDNIKRYQEILDTLCNQNRVFACQCSRKQVAATPTQNSGGATGVHSGVYAGTCRELGLPRQHNSLRVRAAGTINFDDAIQGSVSENIATQVGDFIVKRRDGLVAYQLAVVIDDADQQITDVVRGADLLDSTPRQIYLQQLLQLPTPAYCHLPVAVDRNGQKLSKQTFAQGIDAISPLAALVAAWVFLGQTPQPPDSVSIEAFWPWAIEHWRLDQVPRVAQQSMPENLFN